MTLYEAAKQMIANEVSMDHVNFNRKVCEVATKMLEKDYWMLLCRERNDFTIFRTVDTNECKKVVKELIPTLKNRGIVLLIDKQADGAYEIWIRDPETEENFAYYLFDYSNAIIDIKD